VIFRELPRDRFLRLVEESRDRPLTDEEVAFLERNEAADPSLVDLRSETHDVFDLLQSASVDLSEPVPLVEQKKFEDRILRKVNVQMVREGVQYWTPGFIGAGLACLILIAAFQVFQTSLAPGQSKSSGDASIVRGSEKEPALVLPEFESKEVALRPKP